MEKIYLKDMIDKELCHIQMNEELRNRIKCGHHDRHYYRKTNTVLRRAIACMVCFMLFGTTVYAGYYIWNKVQINGEVLPEIDSMQVIHTQGVNLKPNEVGMYEKDYTSYTDVQDDLGVTLLDSDFSSNNPYMLGHLMTDNKDFAIITIDNYIVGDTSNFQFLEDEKRYSYSNGKIYYTPISLTVDVILSETQMENGWDTEYLGYYEYVEQYISEQGYKVNVLQNTTGKGIPGVVSEKVAIFVADGIRYTLKGRTSMDEIKKIVNSMMSR